MIVLYETWARLEDSPIHTGTSTSITFPNPTEMMQELHSSYETLRKRLASKDPKAVVVVAPIGTAFAMSFPSIPT
jgi:hypothetical protein